MPPVAKLLSAIERKLRQEKDYVKGDMGLGTFAINIMLTDVVGENSALNFKLLLWCFCVMPAPWGYTGVLRSRRHLGVTSASRGHIGTSGSHRRVETTPASQIKSPKNRPQIRVKLPASWSIPIHHAYLRNSKLSLWGLGVTPAPRGYSGILG
jgi:hypothetical protein